MGDSTKTPDCIQAYVSITSEGERMETLKLDFQISHCFAFFSFLTFQFHDEQLHSI